ncbi:glycine/D-amino acid oxidase-like deaminating enzyme [Bradyrhizobium sp. S3.14.4]
MGGGVAGMSAAHELVERGFDVVVLESGDIAGGKARSIPVFHEGEDTSGHQVAPMALGVRFSIGCPASMGFDSSQVSTST